MVDRGEALPSRPGGPDRCELAMQPERAHRCSFAACASAAEKSSARWTMTANRIPAWPRPQNSVALPFVAAGLDRPGCAARFVRAGHRVDLAGEARHPEGVDDVVAGDHDVDGRTGGQVQHGFGLGPAMIGVAEGPDPLPPHGFDARRRAAQQRQEPLAGDQRRRRRAAPGRRPAIRGRRARSSASATRSSPSPADGSPARTGP